MRRLLFIIAVVLLCLFLNSRVAKGDSISAEVGVGDRSTVGYGLTVQHDWSAAYVNLENFVLGNAQSNTTTVAFGIEGLGLNLGVYGGDTFVSGQLTPVFGGEVGGSLPIGKGPFYLKDSIRIGRQSGSDLTYGSMSAGIGLSL